MNHRVNRIFLDSIPLKRKLKRYWIGKYERIASSCGREEADRKMKQLGVAIRSYLSDPTRLSNLAMYLKLSGFRSNGMLRQLFEYAETQPHFVLNFLKMYTWGGQPTKSIDSAAGATKRRLEKVKACSSVPVFLLSWLGITLSKGRKEQWERARRDPSDPFHRLARLHSLSEWKSYWGKWYGILSRGWTCPVKDSKKRAIFPEIYNDFDPEFQSSKSYAKDFGDLVSMHQNDDSPLSDEELKFVRTFLDEDVSEYLDQVLWGEDPTAISGVFRWCNILSGHSVGQVQHIRKKGSGSDYRDIAVPNRFIQLALSPGADRLYRLVDELPRDATCDQKRFDTKIQNRVNNPNLYQGSVDLSKATDNLPLTWGESIISHLRNHFDRPMLRPEVELIARTFKDEQNIQKIERIRRHGLSMDLFHTVARAKWEDEGYLMKWTVGQPLGTLPSFAVLAITHNLVLESMAAHLGLRHSPYCVLGDDVVIFNKKLRKRYIREFTSRAIPLSLQKSFEGRLSEFAGKTYIRNCVPFHTPDQSMISWDSLFDWQRVSGIRIPWANLPNSIRRRLIRVTRDQILGTVPSRSRLEQLAKRVYDLILICEVWGRGSHIYPIKDSDSLSEQITGYFMNRVEDHPVPDPLAHSGITFLGGHPITLMGSEFADKNGYFQRFRPVALPEWYKVKFRPCTTEAMVRASARAISRFVDNPSTL